LETRRGVEHSCARLADGKVFCWRANRSGQLGNGTLEDFVVSNKKGAFVFQQVAPQ
jgi:alpha-tubulin suppressor-like RCC1 family protein